MSKAVLGQRLPLSILITCRQHLQRIPSYRPFTTSFLRNAEASPLGALGQAETDRALSQKSDAAKYGVSDEPTNPKNPRDLRAHHFHIYATKHNTHINLTNPDRDSLISLSAGNIGFRKAARGTYDAAYQLAAYVLGRVQEEGLLQKIKSLEVILRGFGVGREAVTKALLGSEGRLLRPRITQVSDSTRLKFGGTRSKKPRRLG